MSRFEAYSDKFEQVMVELKNNIQACPYYMLGLKLFEPEKKSISKAYRHLARKYHPDKCSVGSDEMMKKINAAYNVLDDLELKEVYNNYVKEHEKALKLTHAEWSRELGDSTVNEGSMEQEYKASEEFGSQQIFDGYVQATSWCLEQKKLDDKYVQSKLGCFYEDTMTNFLELIYPDHVLREYYASENKIAKMYFQIFYVRERQGFYYIYMSELFTKKELMTSGIFMEHLAQEYVFLMFMKTEPNVYIPNTTTMRMWRNEHLTYLPVTIDAYTETHWEKFIKLEQSTTKDKTEASDEDFINMLSKERDTKIILPIHDYEEGYEHFTIVVRRWFQGNLHFFYADSCTDCSLDFNEDDSRYFKEIPGNVIMFLMNSPLWPSGQIAYWSRIPNPRQTESECGFRATIHSLLLALSDNPFQCLLPLQKFMKVKGKRGGGRKKYLNMLLREWMFDCVKSKEFIYPSWYHAIFDDCPSWVEFEKKFKDWRELFCDKIISDPYYCIALAIEELNRKNKGNDDLFGEVVQEEKSDRNSYESGKVVSVGAKENDTLSTVSEEKDGSVFTYSSFECEQSNEHVEHNIPENVHVDEVPDTAQSSGGENVEMDEQDTSIPVSIKVDTKKKEEDIIDMTLDSDESVVEEKIQSPTSEAAKVKPSVNSSHKPQVVVEIVDSESEESCNPFLIDLKATYQGEPIFSCALPENVQHILEVDWGDIIPPRVNSSDPCNCTPTSSSSSCCLDNSCIMFACQEECGLNCPAGRNCGNKRIYYHCWKHVQVFNTHSEKGLGLRTLEDIGKGEFVTEYVGEIIKKSALFSRSFQALKPKTAYMVKLCNEFYIDASTRGGLARYINHSCNPNCILDRWIVAGVTRLVFFAKRNIPVGEELTFDYNLGSLHSASATKCLCNEITCRKTIEKNVANTKLKGTYRVYLPVTNEGLLLALGLVEAEDREIIGLDFSVCFVKYNRFKDGTIGPSEEKQLFRSTKDIVISLNGFSVKGLGFNDVIDMFKKITEESVKNKWKEIQLIMIDRSAYIEDFCINSSARAEQHRKDIDATGSTQHKDIRPENDSDKPKTRGRPRKTSKDDVEQQFKNKDDTSSPSTPRKKEGVQEKKNSEDDKTEPTTRQSPRKKKGVQEKKKSEDDEEELMDTDNINTRQSPRKKKDSSNINETYKPHIFWAFEYRQLKKAKQIYKILWIGHTIEKEIELSKDWIMTYFGVGFCSKLMERINKKVQPTEKDKLWEKSKPIHQAQYVSDGDYYMGFTGPSDSEKISPEWIVENFSSRFLQELRDNPNNKIHVRVGCAKRKLDNFITGVFPATMFKQSGLNTCLFSSLASGLSYLRDNYAAKNIIENRMESMHHTNVFQFAEMLLQHPKFNYYVKKFKTGSQFNLLKDVSCFPTVVQLLSGDGNVNHAVTIIGLWVFESNSSEAKILSQDTLNYCCSTSDTSDICRGFKYAIRFLHNKPLKHWNMCNSCRRKESCQYGRFRQFY